MGIVSKILYTQLLKHISNAIISYKIKSLTFIKHSAGRTPIFLKGINYMNQTKGLIALKKQREPISSLLYLYTPTIIRFVA